MIHSQSARRCGGFFSSALACVLVAGVLTGCARAANTPPDLQSRPILTGANPNFIVGDTLYVGQIFSTTVYAFDADGDTLMYKFDFGDGTATAFGPNNFDVAHAYTTPGTKNLIASVSDGTVVVTQTLTVIVTPTLVGANIGNGFDEDGDGFSNQLEDELQTNKIDSTSTPLPGNAHASAARVLPFGITKGTVALNFQKPTLNDSIKFAGDMYVLGPTTADGKVAQVDIGGVVRKFTLDAKGNGTLNNKADSIKINGRFGANNIGVKNGTFKVAITISKATLATTFANAGLTNVTTSKQPVTIPVILLFDGSAYQQSLILSYTCVFNKAGVAK